MSRFDLLWNAHPGRANVCDATVFTNQCAMRIGKALREIGVGLAGLKTCYGYDRKKFETHKPGHTRSAQQVANHFYRKPKAHNLGARSFKIYPGSITKNINVLKDKKGMIFIMNGWGSTDHIDVWKGNGTTGTLKGGESSYFIRGQEIWLWEFD
jgi:hypothetical protein